MDFLTADEISARASGAGLSLPQLCANAGIALSTFYSWRAGTHRPNTATYEKVIRALKDAEHQAKELTP